MPFPDAFTLYTSESATVRVEPPDIVIVERPGFEKQQFARSRLRVCDAMLVEIYRQGYDPSFPAGRDGDIVVRLGIDGVDVELIGPFPWQDGVDLAEAIRGTRRHILYARPRLAVVLSDDESYVLIGDGHRHVRARTSTSGLLELTPCEKPNLDGHHVIESAVLPRAGEPHWVRFDFTTGRPWFFGPFSQRSATTISHAFAEWRRQHPVDLEPVEVAEEALVAQPHRWHLRRIAVTGTWFCGFERSGFAGAWLRPLDEGQYGTGTYRTRVVGTWVFPQMPEGHYPAYGHMGGSPGELRAETIEILSVSDRGPGTDRDGLTGLLNRRAVEVAFPRLRSEVETSGGAVSFALINLDRFKRFNDAHGHAAGDEVIRTCAATVAAAVRSGDVVARWRGEEFAVVMPATTLEVARVLIERVVEAVRALRFELGEQVAHVTCSAGVAQMRRGDTMGQLARLADQALYQAKEAGGDRLMTSEDQPNGA